MSSQVQIPIELLELIVDNVDFLFSDGRQTLVTCSYANRALSVMCQKRIFRDIQIRQKVDRVSRKGYLFTEVRGTDGERFLKLIKTRQSRHVASYVRNLAINIVHALQYNHVHHELDSRNYNSTDSDFPLYAIVPRLRNLKRFAVISTIPGMSVEWDSIGRRLPTFLSDLAQRLPELDFRFFSDMGIETFSDCPTLEVLHISAVHTTQTLPPSRAKLSFLDIGYDSPAQVKGDRILAHFDPTYSPLDITHLTGLKLSSIEFFASDIDNILALCANTLESFDLRVGRYGECKLSYTLGYPVSRSEATPPNLSSLHKLRSLTIRTNINGYARPGEEDFYSSNTPFVSAILQTLPPKIHSPFELVLDTHLSQFNIARLANFPWSEIVDVLDQDPFSRCLTTLKFIFQPRLIQQQDDRTLDSNHLAEILDRNDDLRRLEKKDLCLVSTSDFDFWPL